METPWLHEIEDMHGLRDQWKFFDKEEYSIHSTYGTKIRMMKRSPLHEACAAQTITKRPDKSSGLVVCMLIKDHWENHKIPHIGVEQPDPNFFMMIESVGNIPDPLGL